MQATSVMLFRPQGHTSVSEINHLAPPYSIESTVLRSSAHSQSIWINEELMSHWRIRPLKRTNLAMGNVELNRLMCIRSRTEDIFNELPGTASLAHNEGFEFHQCLFCPSTFDKSSKCSQCNSAMYSIHLFGRQPSRWRDTPGIDSGHL